MQVRSGRKILGLVASAMLVTAGLVLHAEQVVQAASFVDPPERLYMVPSDVQFEDLETFATNAAIPALVGIPIGTLQFGGASTDPISGDPYKITVDTVNGDAGCDLAQPPYDDDDCSRLQLSGVQSGRLSMGAISTIEDGEGPGLDVYLLPSGARIDNPYQVAAGSYSLGINGTPAQLQAALDDLVYTPDSGYYYAGGPNDPEILNIVVVPGNSDDPDPTPDPKTTDSIDIDIRVLKINGFPSHDGPSNRTAQPDVELKMPAVDPPAQRPYPSALFTVADPDNDESIDTDPPDGALPDGANSSMMLIGWLDCGASPVLDDGQHGFHFRGGTFQSDDVQIEDFFELLYNVSANPDYQFVIDRLVDALDAIDPDLKNIVLATSNPSDYTTAFAGVGDIAAVEYALSQVSFRHDDPGATCELITVVLDLGNNGLPLQYLGSPPTGIEVPFIGFDWNVLTLNVDQPEVIDISFDPEPIYVMEGNPTEARMLISPTPHPEFQIGWDAEPRIDDPAVPGRATANVDFAGTFNNSPTIPADVLTVSASTNLTLQLPDEMVYADNELEGTETFVYRILPDAYDPPPGYAITSTTPTRTVYILDDDDAPRKVLSIVGSTTLEGDPGDDRQLTFEVMLDGLADGNESFDVAIAPSSTADGTDHGPVSSTTVNFAPGQESAIVTVPITEDLADELNETVVLALSNLQNMDPTGPTEATGTIQNDDAPRIVSVDDVSRAEGDGGTSVMTFTVSLDLPAKGTESITASTADGSATDLDNDYEPNTQVLSFADGETSKPFQVTINGDNDVEPDQTFDVLLGTNVNVTIGDGTGVGTITNDDGVPAASINNAQIVEGHAGTTALNFTISLSAPAIQPSSVTVTSNDVTAAAGSDFASLGQLVSFATGEDSKQVSVSITGDSTGEFDETFTLLLSDPIGVTIGDGSGTGTITNDDLDVSFVAQAPVAEGAPASIVVAVFPPTHPEVSVGVTTVDGSAIAGEDYTAFDAPVVIPANQASSAPTSVFTSPDFDFEPDEQFTATLTPQAVPGFIVRWDDVPATYTILDDDPQSVVSIADAAVVEGGASNQVSVSMTNVLPTRVCNVSLTSTVGTALASDFTALAGSPLAVDAVSEVVPLGITNDPDVEGVEDFTIGMTLDPNQPNCVLGDAQSTVTIVDNDDPTPSLSIADASIDEGTGAGTTTISFALTTSGLQPADCGFRAVVTQGTTNDADFVSTAFFDVTGVFDTNDLVLDRTFGITRDVFDEPDETFTLTITGNGATPCTIGDGVATGTIVDDDGPLPTLSVADASVVEGTGAGTTTIDLVVSTSALYPVECGFRAVLTNASTSDDDFTSAAFFDVTAVWDTDDQNLPRSFGVTRDALDELNETFTLTLSPDSAHPVPCAIGDGVATGTIVDDDGAAPDDVKPTVTINQAIGQADPTPDSPIQFTVVFSEPVTGFDAADVALAGTAGADTVNVTGSGANYTVAVSGMTQAGTVSASIVAGGAQDASANTNVASTSTDNTVTFVVVPVLLTLDVPGGIVRNNDPGQAGAIVTYPSATASGGVPPIVVSCATASGSFFPIGTTTVSCTATDSDSEQAIVSGSFTVTVVDAEPPVISDNPDLVRTTADPTGIAVTFALPTASDNSGVAPTVTCNRASGSTFPIGVTTVTCTATDGAGNTASSAFTVTVSSSGGLPPLGGGLPETGGSPARLLALAAMLVALGLVLSRRFPHRVR